MKISKKIAVAAIPAVMALASTNVDSKILLMSQEGWEVSFDGAANAFIMQNSGTNAPTTAGGTTDITFTSTQNNLGVYYTKMSWFQTLGIKLQKVSNLIHQKTLRGGANFMVVSPKVSTIMESIPGFAADSAGDQNKYNMGVQKIGAINNRYTVYKNPYMVENVILMGIKDLNSLKLVLYLLHTSR